MTDYSTEIHGTIADIFINIPAKSICKYFSYVVQPGTDVVPGCRVVVPFSGRTVEGVVIDIRYGETAGLKAVESVIDKWFSPNMLQLARKISEYYLCSISETLKLFIPGGRSVKKNNYRATEKNIILLQLTGEKNELGSYRNKPAQRRLLERLAGSPAPLSVLRAEGFGSAVIKALEAEGAVKRCAQRVYRDSYANLAARNSEVVLNAGQQAAFDTIVPEIDNRSGRKFMLFGVTGSGKTEVYMRLAKYACDKKLQSVVLVPEIALTAQLVERFRSVFGKRVGVAHSRLSAEERCDIFDKARLQEIDVLIGARSALFAPFANLGLIVVDEEHETSYKQEDRPYYNTRTVAGWLAELDGAALVLGSATPSVETWYSVQRGMIKLLELPYRATGAELPEIVIVNMCEQFAAGNRSMLSLPLQQLLRETLDRQEQAIVLLNRRGHSTFVSCRECGHVMQCPACDVSLTYHNSGSNLRCHYCGRTRPVPLQCPHCQSPYIRYFGTGTQKVEAELAKTFPDARILRMDQDTVGGKRGHEKIINMFRSREYDILIGTQMVAKGHDIANVSAVGIISADTALNMPDFRAHERTYSLLTQAAGRAGRGNLPGRVVIQSYNPDHYAISSVRENDYRNYYRQEIEWREGLNYPPYSHMIKILVRDKDEKSANDHAADIAGRLRCLNKVEVIGPAPALISRLNSEYRRLVLVKSDDAVTANMALKAAGIKNDNRTDIDVDPVNIL